MDDGGGEKKLEDYSHYNHTDACKHLRWTARECYEYMYERPWQEIVDFYSDLVLGNRLLSGLLGSSHNDFNLDKNEDCIELEEDMHTKDNSSDKGGRWARSTFKIVLSYHGGSFDGWQKQPGLNTVQAVVERSLGHFVDEMKAKQLKDKLLPVEPSVVVAGRTDKGVTALQQVCSFYTWRNDIFTRDIEDAVNKAMPGKLRALCVSKVSRMFHPNFTAKWRRYIYIFPINDEVSMENVMQSDAVADEASDGKVKNMYIKLDRKLDCIPTGINGEDMICRNSKPQSFSIGKVNQLLQQLVGKSLSYKMFARDTKASRNFGPATECYMYHARAAERWLTVPNKECLDGRRVLCVELVANRFLRRMVRVLVATTIREAAAGAADDILLELMVATCRRATAPPAPPEGLCLAEIGYREFEKESCWID